MRSSAAMSGIVLGDPAEAIEEEPVGELHDVGLVDGRDPLAPVPPRVIEGELRDPRGGALRDDLQGLDDSRHDRVLEAAVEVLGVLADDDEVDVLEPAGDRGHVLDRPEVGVEVERLAQPDVDRGEALSDGRAYRALERDAGCAGWTRGRARRAGDLLRASRPRRPTTASSNAEGSPAASRIESDGVGHLRADTVSPDQSDGAESRHASAPALFLLGGRIIMIFLIAVGRGFLDHEVGVAPLPSLALSRDASEAEHEVARDGLGLVARERDARTALPGRRIGSSPSSR